MESSLTNACKIKIEKFEGPLDLLFHLIEKNKMNIYDIPISEITDQYMDYLFSMKQMDLEIASEFLVMASALLHIKSKMLLPKPKKEENSQEEEDPRQQLVVSLLEYKKYKQFSMQLSDRMELWSKVFYKEPEMIEFAKIEKLINLCPFELRRTYLHIMGRNAKKANPGASNITEILKTEKVTLKSKINEIISLLARKAVIIFSSVFSLAKRSRTEVVTGFLAVLELAKLKKIRIEQDYITGDIKITKCEESGS
mgnify:CR=1 FL=1